LRGRTIRSVVYHVSARRRSLRLRHEARRLSDAGSRTTGRSLAL
jgi:hypothetical protein